MDRQDAETKPSEVLIKCDQVNKYYGDLHVLKDISLEINKSETLVIIGPSGGGKSTLGRCLNKLEEIDSGTIFFEGVAFPAMHPRLFPHIQF